MKGFKNVLCFIFVSLFLIVPQLSSAEQKKGLLVYDGIYGSTIETAYWIKAIIGHDHHLDVKALSQVITIDPYDYVIIGSLTRWEKASKPIYAFIEDNRADLAKKQVCYFLTCGDTDETMVLTYPGKPAHLIGGRNYLLHTMETFPEIKPVAIAAFGGRQVMPTLNRIDTFWIWMVGKLAKEGSAWEGLDIWESLVPGRVEAFANEIRVKILGLDPLEPEELKPLRGYWQSLQPASLEDPSKKKYVPRPFEELHATDRVYYLRTRVNGDLENGRTVIKEWAEKAGLTLNEQVTTFFNSYIQAVKNYDGREMTIHVVPATMPEDPGYVHFSFRSYDKPDRRTGVEKDILKAREMIKALKEAE